IATNPKHCKNVNYTEAKKFINWLTSDDTLSFISGFKLLYKPLFVVDAKTRKD
ncbi:tungsten ABC transporter substrate-binding protein, partial [Campylobacter coli]